MAEFPALPLWTDSWVADTKHLTRLERGTYHDLLVLMWRSPDCRVPNDDAWLAKRLSMTLSEVLGELRPIITEFCKSTGNWLTQKRLSREFAYVTEQRRLQSERAKSRWNKDKNYARASAAGGNAPTTLPTPTPLEEGSTTVAPKKARTAAPKKPLALDDEMLVWVQENCPGIDPAYELRKHLDWKASKGRTYRDDRAAFRNWCSNSQERANQNTGSSHGRPEKPTPLGGLYGGAALAIERREAQRLADSGTSDDPAEPLLDSGGGRTIESASNLRLVG